VRRAAAATSPTCLLCRKSKQRPSGVTEIPSKSVMCVKTEDRVLGTEVG
jgi:hypothetical protein